MDSNLSDRNYLVFLDRINSRYPAGIPQSYISSDSNSRFSSSNRCVIVVLNQNGNMSEAQTDLVDAILTKGLKLGRDECQLYCFKTSDYFDGFLAKNVDLSQCSLAFILGSVEAPGSITQIGSTSILNSYGIDAIGGDNAVKREFWTHLKGVLHLLTRG